jgi:ATP-dependent DNA ligase
MSNTQTKTSSYETSVSNGSCSCLAWKYQRKPAYARTCKHLIAAGYEVTTEGKLWKDKVAKPKIMLYTDDLNCVPDTSLYSEKLDGVRGMWSGSRMISRGGLIIDIPDRIRNQLGKTKLDGEFWKQRHALQAAIDATQSDKDSKVWTGVNFYVFDVHNKRPFSERYEQIKTYPHFCRHKLLKRVEVMNKLNNVSKKGGEGLVIRSLDGIYKNYGRSNDVIKVKPVRTGEAEYVTKGYFKELGQSDTFKMRAKGVMRGDIVTFHFTERTSTGKPKYPRLCHIE